MLDRENALSMENEEYQEICKQLGETVFSKLEYVLNADFDQKTEQASLVVQMLDIPHSPWKVHFRDPA